jgi:uncharacterized membrane protein YdjX (TVP38/TMEM64 family)
LPVDCCLLLTLFIIQKRKNLMVDEIDHDSGKRRHAVLKAIAFAVFLIAAIYLVRFTSVRNYLTPEAINAILEKVGIWAPVLFIFIYAVGVCLFVPGLLLTGIGALLFGPYRGFIYIWVGAMIGASGAFFIGRTLGRDFASTVTGDRLKKYDDAIEKNGFTVVLYLRLLYFPFTPMNFGMGLTKVRFRDYLLGTGIGIMVGTFIIAFFIGTLKDVWVSGNWSNLLSFKVIGSLCLFAFSFFIPMVIKKIKMSKE